MFNDFLRVNLLFLVLCEDLVVNSMVLILHLFRNQIIFVF
jgi:hypothetical protein